MGEGRGEVRPCHGLCGGILLYEVLGMCECLLCGGKCSGDDMDVGEMAVMALWVGWCE